MTPEQMATGAFYQMAKGCDAGEGQLWWCWSWYIDRYRGEGSVRMEDWWVGSSEIRVSKNFGILRKFGVRVSRKLGKF